MDLKFSEMSVDTSLAQEYLKKNAALLELYNDYNGTIGKFVKLNSIGLTYSYDGKVFMKKTLEPQNIEPWDEGHQNIVLKMASKLKENATLITQLEYYTRNIPIEDTSAQLNLIIQHIRCRPKSTDVLCSVMIYPDDPLLFFARHIFNICRGTQLDNTSKETAPICHLLVTLLLEAGAKDVVLDFVHTTSVSHRFEYLPKTWAFKGLNSGTVAVVSDDADVDSAVDKFIAVSIQAPWRLRRILVQESVYEQFKDALSWKCNLNESVRKSLTSDVLCSDALTCNDKTFLIDPVELTQETPPRHVVTVEAYRTTKEMIFLVQQYKARYLSLWTNGIAEINEVTHSTMSPVVWVNNLADFRGPPQISEAVVSCHDHIDQIKKCKKVARLCELSQSWLKLDLESRRDILYRFLDQCILLDPKKPYADIKKSLSACTLNSFVDVGKDYVCIGMSQAKGIVGRFYKKDYYFFSSEMFELILKGNALILFTDEESGPVDFGMELFEQSGIPVAYLDFVEGDFPICISIDSPTRTRVVWTNSGTIFAN